MATFGFSKAKRTTDTVKTNRTCPAWGGDLRAQPLGGSARKAVVGQPASNQTNKTQAITVTITKNRVEKAKETAQ